MALWIGIHLPLLALETLRPRWSKPCMFAVLEHEQVLAMSASAAAAGVRPGMRRGGVLALAPETLLCERDAGREQGARDDIALTLLQYTPEVAHAEEDSLLLDVSASLSAFGGRLALCRRIRDSVQALGFSLQLSMAPTAQGAWLLARYRRRHRRPPLPRQRRSLGMASMQRRLDALPFVILPAARPYQEWLTGIGCQTLADLRKLPRAGLQRRSDQQLLASLDRAYGTAPEIFDWVQPPQTFSAWLELPDRIEHAEAVLFAARRLILQMTGWLVAQQLAVSCFRLSLEHERGRQAIAPTPLEISLAEAAWHEEHLLRLLKERLGRLQLEAPVIALRLQAMQVVPMLPPTASLFPEPGGTPGAYARLLELLSARLGSENVLQPAAQADYRPEIANAWQAAAAQGHRTPQENRRALSPARPFWLLQAPLALAVRNHRPFYSSPLRLLAGPERIECSWWDGVAAVRDYFIAEGDDAACYWIYRQRSGDDIYWFLHGLFA
ncbi:DNA polymerase Y family protein [Collimonas pratensis]|uniref:Y-family DNA polymerase n=1 Tax=Collimonas pratensis TaxID=279113 RepID=UPI00143DA806|nr:DNA polymerase Y family protein [Collimonas pratensis]NKI68844.1 DNA polymerase Y family protein [Collimonas pratensis]